MTTENNSKQGLTRREFTGLAAGLAAAAAVSGLAGTAKAQQTLAFPALPYPEDALEPYISARTLSFHYGKHHRAYYDNTVKLLSGNPLAGQPLEKIIVESAKDQASPALFNNSAQLWNHTFYFQGLKKGGGGPAPGKLGEMINKSFGSMDNFHKEFVDAAMGQFGSGWAWLVADGGSLKVVKTPNAVNPLVAGQKPILTADVWEHAYYLDYQNRRKDYLEAFMDHLIDWDFAAKNLG
jgi:Fe-Mn family superoxide dismutase